MIKAYKLTTKDNPWNPVDQFDRWLRWDIGHNHGCDAMLDRYSYTDDSMSPAEYQEELNRAINEIIEYDFEGIYEKYEYEIDENEEE